MATPQRGDVWLVDFGIVGKVRPALVISIPIEDADRALVTLVPHTTSCRQSRFEIAFETPFLKSGAFDGQQIATVSQSKLIRCLGRLRREQLDQVEAGVRDWLGLA